MCRNSEWRRSVQVNKRNKVTWFTWKVTNGLEEYGGSKMAGKLSRVIQYSSNNNNIGIPFKYLEEWANSVDSPYTTVAPERTRKQLLFSFLFFSFLLPLVGGPASGYGIKLAEAKHCLESIMACCKWQSRTYSIRNSSGDDRLDDDARTSSTDDAESQSGSIVDKVDHLHLGPFRVELSWRQEEKKKEIDYKMKKKTKIRVTGHIHSP